MPAPTIAFSLISFADIKAAPNFSASKISRTLLHDRTIFVKTSANNYAKMHVHSGPGFHIRELTVYNAVGCIIKTATNLDIAANASCDLDTATQTNTNCDFTWEDLGGGNSNIVPKGGATFTLFKDFDATGFNEIKIATYKNQKIAREWLDHQLIFCKTSQGRFAKLRLETGNDLKVSRMTVYNSDGTIHLEKANFTIPQTWTLDIDTGNVGAAGHDLWWEAVDAATFFLVPSNGASISFDSYYQYEKYLPLIKNSAIRNAMVISGSSDRNYNSWTEAEKLQLREFIYLLETGQSLPIVGPPALVADQFMKACDATKIYMAHVAQSLWVDANNKVGWILSAATANHLTHLFDMRKLFLYTAGSGHSFDVYTMGYVTDWSPALSYKFLTDNNLIKGNHWETIKAVVDWVRANLQHIMGYANDNVGGPFASQLDQWEYIYGYRGYPPVDKVVNPLPGHKHITHGCWGTDGFLAAVLRTVNIPVKHGRSNFSGDMHSRPEFFTVSKNLKHGDDPYNGWVRKGINNVPVDKLFLSDAEIISQIDAPVPLPGKTVPETASFNHEKHSIVLAVQYKTNYLLRYRCTDKTSGINTGSGSKVWENLHKFYTDAQIATIVTECDAAIAAIPGGCPAIPYV